MDTSYNPDLQLASALWIHEGHGHGIGLQHTRGGLMNPSIIRTPLSWKHDPSWAYVKRYYGGVPLEPKPDPDPGPKPDPEPDPPICRGSIQVSVGEEKYKVFVRQVPQE